MSLRVALAQLNFKVGDVKGNSDLIVAAAVQARDELAADVLVFPELSLTGYPPEDLLMRPELHNRVEAALESITATVSGIALVLGYPRKVGNVQFNAAGVIQDGRIVAEYHKAYLPNYSVFDEKRYFTPGDKPCVVELKGYRLGITICEDIWFEAPARSAAEQGANILLNLNASPFHIGMAVEREEMVSKRARENQLSVIYVNLVGGQDELTFDGGSFTVNAAGKLVQRAASCEQQLALVEFDDQGQPGGAVIEPLLSENQAIYAALVMGVRDYVTKNGFNGVILGLSGGIDSALTLCLAVDALGPEQVEVVMMPSRYTADMSNTDALTQAEILGVHHYVIPIEPAFKAFQEMLAPAFAGASTDVTEENIQARCRGVILMALSNKQGRMLLTTGNKSEMAVGYATLYGDMAGGFAPLKDLSKKLVYRLANWCNREQIVIPERVISRPPSAELRPDQKDSDSLPDYDVLDEILSRYIEHDQDIEIIVAAGFEQSTVERITGLVDRNEYKRRQAPPGVRITKRAFGRDRRYPIVNGF